MSDNFWDHLGDIAVLAAAAWALFYAVFRLLSEVFI